MTKDNVLSAGDIKIVIQSCDTKTANIGIFENGKSAYHHVSIPGLVREYKRHYPSYLSNERYDEVTAKYAAMINNAIDAFNAPNEPAGITAYRSITIKKRKDAE